MNTVKSYWQSLVSRWPDVETLPARSPLRLALVALYFLLGRRPLFLAIILGIALYRSDAGPSAYYLAVIYVFACERVWYAIAVKRHIRDLEARNASMAKTLDNAEVGLGIVKTHIGKVGALAGFYMASVTLPPFLHLRQGVAGQSLH